MWMSPNTSKTRLSQWRKYFEFCALYEFHPLPADECLACLYITHLSESLSYNSIVNYLSALWALHKVSGCQYPDPSSFIISSTLKGARFELGCVTKQAPPMQLASMRAIFLSLNMSVLDDLVLWIMLLAGFRGLLRKGNLCEAGFAVCYKDVEFCDWGVILSIRKSKTITAGERVFKAPFDRINCSCFCFDYYLQLYLSSIAFHSVDQHLFSRYVKGKITPVSYGWFGSRLRNVCVALGLPAYTSHSLRRGGAQALANIGIPLHELKEIGDWRSWSVLLYLARPLEQRILLDASNCAKLFS